MEHRSNLSHIQVLNIKYVPVIEESCVHMLSCWQAKPSNKWYLSPHTHCSAILKLKCYNTLQSWYWWFLKNYSLGSTVWSKWDLWASSRDIHFHFPLKPNNPCTLLTRLSPFSEVGSWFSLCKLLLIIGNRHWIFSSNYVPRICQSRVSTAFEL